MNITKENIDDLNAIIKAEIAEEDYQENVKKTLKDHQRKSNMPGFRPGKVPFGMINKMYGAAVLVDEVNKILSENLTKYITDNELEILGNPIPNIEKSPKINWKEDKIFHFHFDIGLAPKFELELSDKIKVDYYDIKADDAVAEKYITDIQNRNGSRINPEISDEGDSLKGEFVELDETGNFKEDGIKNTSSISIEFVKLKTIRNKLIGLKVGDKVKFNPYRATKNAVETAAMLGIKKEEAEKIENEFRFTVEEISNMKKAELNEELFKKIYPAEEIKTIEEFKERIKKDAANSFTLESNKKFAGDTIKTLIKEANLSLPDEFLKKWLLESNKDEITQEQVETQYESYKDTLKWQLLENKLIKNYNLKVTDEDIKAHIKGYMSQYMGGHEKMDEQMAIQLDKMAESMLKNEEEMKKINDQLFDKKLLDLFKSNIKIKNKDVSYEEFIKLVSENKK